MSDATIAPRRLWKDGLAVVLTFAIVAILNSVVSAAVYLRVLVALYMLPKEAGAEGPRFTWPLVATVLAGVIVLLWLGIVPASLAALGRP